MRGLALVGAALVGAGTAAVVMATPWTGRSRRLRGCLGVPTRAGRAGGVALELAGRADAVVSRRGWARALSRELPRAGLDVGAGTFLLAVGGGAAVAAAMVAAATGSAVAGAVIAGVALALPRVVIRRRARRWLEHFEAELPEALDLLAGGLEAGAPLVHALELVAREGRPPLSNEFARTLADTRLGRSLVDALEAAADRVGSRDFTWCVRAVRAQQEFGASLAELLRTLAEFVRWRHELRGEVRALTAEGRVSAYVLVALPFLVTGFFLLTNPAYLGTLVVHPLGRTLILVAALLVGAGTAWMRRIVRVEV